MPCGPKEMHLSCREKEMPEHIPAPVCDAHSEHCGGTSDLMAMMGTRLHTQAAHPGCTGWLGLEERRLTWGNVIALLNHLKGSCSEVRVGINEDEKKWP